MPERGEKRREKTAGSCRLAVRCLAVGLSLLMLMPTVLPLHAQAASSEKTESVAEKSGANKEKPEKKPGASPTASPTPSPSPGKVAGSSDEEAAYAAAEALLEEGRPGAAALAFRALGKYRDAESRSAECWALSRVNMSIAAGVEHTIGIKEDGTMMVCGYLEKKKCNVSRWKDVVSVAAGPEHSVGLKADGTLVAVGLNTGGECHLQDWDHIVAIAAGDARTVGLRADGTVLAKGKNDVGDCEVSDWTDIVAVASGNLHTLGLKADGTVLAVGQNNDGQCDVSDWTDIVAIAAGSWNSFGIKADGTVVSTGWNDMGQCDVSDWTDIVQVSAGKRHTVGLRSDGTCVAVGEERYKAGNVADWTDIVQICAGENYTVGIKADGTGVAVGYNQFGMCYARTWEDLLVPEKPEAAHNDAEADESLAGEYRSFAMAQDDVCIAIPEGTLEGDDGLLTLRDDGTGSLMTGDVENRFRWTREGDELLLTDESGTMPLAVTMRVDRGVLVLEMFTGLQGETRIRNYYAKPGTDTSFVETISPEEYVASLED